MTRLSVLLLLLVPADAWAGAGGGSGGFGGGGGGGGGGGFSGGGGSGGSGGGSPLVVLVIFAIVAIVFAYGALKVWQLNKKRAARVARTRTASAEAAEDDAYFAADAVERDAAALFVAAQKAWDERDRTALERMIGEDLMIEWRRRLDDFDRKGWHNRVTVKEGPSVEYVHLVNREDDGEDRVCVRLTAEMRDVVETRTGGIVKKTGASSEVVSVAEYWTLARRGDRWIVASIESDAEGAHNLDAPLVPSPWSDDQQLFDEAVVERASADAALPDGVRAADLVDVDFADDARKAALDLALVDQRFGPDVLEVAARRAVSAWAQAVDGPDDALRAVADDDVIRDLLYAADASARTRLVVRGPRLESLAIVALDGDGDPPSFTVEARVRGRRYVEDRDTTTVVSGSKDAETTFTERWRLALSGDAEQPWRLAAAGERAAT
jgi:predicted lipid-binding transport protein (Tim44 family)